MSPCVVCGSPTPRRKCRACDLADRYEGKDEEAAIEVVCVCGERHEWDPIDRYGRLETEHDHEEECDGPVRYQGAGDDGDADPPRSRYQRVDGARVLTDGGTEAGGVEQSDECPLCGDPYALEYSHDKTTSPVVDISDADELEICYHPSDDYLLYVHTRADTESTGVDRGDDPVTDGGQIVCRGCGAENAPDAYRCEECQKDLVDQEPEDGESEADLAPDGGEDLPAPIDWPFEAVVFGADVDEDCLALTNAGKPCTYNAYPNELPVCNTHADVDDPNVVEDAHQWARIRDDDEVVTVCVNCHAVWSGYEPETSVACPTCAASPGGRCKRETSGAGYSAPIPPHPERRRRAYEAVAELEPCAANPAGEPTDGQTTIADGGRDHAWIVECPHGERTVLEDDSLATCAAYLQEDVGRDDWRLSIATWDDGDVAADGGERTDPARASPECYADGGIEEGWYVLDEERGVVLDGSYAYHGQAMIALPDQEGEDLVVASAEHLRMLREQGDDLEFDLVTDDDLELLADGAGELQPRSYVGECPDCDGRMIEFYAYEGSDRRCVQLRCQDCEAVGEFEMEFASDSPLEEAETDGVRDVSLEEVDFVRCTNCHGSGEVVGCIDDICHGKGHCIHDGNDPCPSCQGSGRVPRVAETDGAGEQPGVSVRGSETPLTSQQRCPGCDAIRSQSAAFCKECGRALDEEERVTQLLVAELAMARVEADRDVVDHDDIEPWELGYEDVGIGEARERIERWLDEIDVDLNGGGRDV